MPVVSVVIPCYNLGSYLDEAVNSVLQQRYRDFEVLVIDDGSTEPLTIGAVDRQAAKPGVRVFHTPNQGLPATRNFGISQALGRYICCLDADDLYQPHFLEETVAVLESDREGKIGIVTTMVKVFENQNAIWSCADFDPALLGIENVIHVASLFRRSAWEEVGGYALNLSGFQDWDFWIALVERGYEWRRVKRPLFHYRDREGSMIKSSESKRRELKARIVANHPDFFARHHVAILDLYEESRERLGRESKERELALGRLALEKVQKLQAAYQALESGYDELKGQLQTLKRGR